MAETEVTEDEGGPGILRHIHNRIELLATILLAIAAVATAWSSYQSARWSGVQAIDFAKANAARVESTRASTEAGQQTQVDVLTFTQWVDAYAAGDKRLSGFYFARFRPEFKPAAKAWVATRPLKNPNAPPTPFSMPEYKLAAATESEQLVDQAETENPDAPPTPFSMPEYKLAAATESEQLVDQAETENAAALESNQRSDNYVLAVVLFAAALFFAGISTKLTRRLPRTGILALGFLFFFGTLAWVVTFPVSFSV